MAEFEDNPFADPKQINPFAVSCYFNRSVAVQFTLASARYFILLLSILPPSQDPSVQQASAPQAPTEEYNPFAQNEPEV